MQDERQETYQRLIAGLLKLPGFRSPQGAWVKVQDVIGLLAEEFLVERRGAEKVAVDGAFTTVSIHGLSIGGADRPTDEPPWTGDRLDE